MPPQLGTQIDRVGRPAISTALIGTFNGDATAAGTLKNQYNTAPLTQGSTFLGEIAANLAIYDGLDRNCGNQLIAGPDPVAGRYDTLATVLTDDRLYVNSASTECTQYLAVEANFVGVVNSDCGGRTPLLDVIDTSYSVLAAGALSGVSDGIAEDGDGAGIHSTTDFPFLAAP